MLRLQVARGSYDDRWHMVEGTEAMILALVNKLMAEAFRQCKLPSELARASWSSRPELGDLQCNAAMALARVERRNPRQIAEDIADKLRSNEAFESVSVAGPGFINIALSANILEEFANAQLKNPLHGSSQFSGRVLIDFGGPNVAKPLHVGHLRSLVIGESLRRILSVSGFEVLSDVHLGDWGLQMGILIAEIKRRWPDLPYFTDEIPTLGAALPFGVDALNTLYPQAAAACREEPARMAEARQITAELQEGRVGYRQLWSELRELSLDLQRRDFELLGAHFDLFLGESDVQRYIPGMIERFKSSGLAFESQGALVIDVREPSDTHDIPPLILSKSDGAALYATTDLATILMRKEELEPNWIIYVVDQRQALHFEQVFRAARKAGIAGDIKLTHAGFGTVNGIDGRPYKTRNGGVALLGDLIDEAVEKAGERLTQSSEAIAKQVGLAALKFADLDSFRTTGYIFDANKLVSFEGRTGPYIQYACVRIKSILSRAEDQCSRENTIKITAAIERELLLECARFPSVLQNAVDSLAPSDLAQFLFTLAKTFTRFYSECGVLSANTIEVRNSRLAICGLVLGLLERGLWLLGIQVPDKM